MSVELPESKILAEQMNQKLIGKQVKSFQTKDCERLQKIGMMEKDLTVFDKLVNTKIETVAARGNVIRIRFGNGNNLILGPEYGGEIFYTTGATHVPNFHLRLDFSDKTVLTVRLTSMGVIQVKKDNELDSSYVYRRDFDATKLSAIEEEFTFEDFSKRMSDQNKMLKSVLVGKDAVLVGVSNSTFQDILFRARIHPKRRASELDDEEMRNLYDAIMFVFNERIRLHGKDKFRDLNMKQGSYTPAMGPNMKEQNCHECGTAIQKLSHGGGHVYLCPNCQN